jgi:cobalt-zinc-cadmium efflux system outer membrane protein
MRRLTALLLTALGGAVAHAGAPASPELPRVLTLEAALALAVARGPDLRLAAAQAASAAGDRTAAAALPNPVVALAVGRSVACGGACGGSAGVAWNASLTDQAVSDTLSGKRRLRVAVADRNLAAARLGIEDARRTLVFRVRQGFLQAVLAREAVRVAREVEDSLVETVALVRRRSQAGAISEADVVRAETAALKAGQDVATATLTYRLARLQLAARPTGAAR